MDLRLIEALRCEEQSILETLRETAPFQRLEALRELLASYDEPPPVGALLDALLPGGERPTFRFSETVIALPGPLRETA